MEMNRILCAVDFSEPSRAAMCEAAQLARHFDADLELFHVYPLPMHLDGTVEPVQIDELLAWIDRTLAAWQREAIGFGAPRVKTRAVQGGAWHEIVARAEESDADLIVVGTHGRTGLRHALVGSVAERVVRHAGCRVLTVHGSAPAAAA
jgi:nucleotide-binding universal stress UspA family protein